MYLFICTQINIFVSILVPHKCKSPYSNNITHISFSCWWVLLNGCMFIPSYRYAISSLSFPYWWTFAFFPSCLCMYVCIWMQCMCISTHIFATYITFTCLGAFAMIFGMDYLNFLIYVEYISGVVYEQFWKLDKYFSKKLLLLYDVFENKI
jgi:hypothetical protein